MNIFNFFLHFLNPLYIYCRLIPFFGKNQAKRMGVLYQNYIWKKTILKMYKRKNMIAEFIDYSKVKKYVNVSGAVILKKNENETKSVLIIQRSKDDHWPLIWEFPRGKCDKKDKNNLRECMQREVKEETGLDVKIIRYINKYEYLADKGTRKSTQYNFLCTLIDPNQKVKLSKEHQDFKWIESIGQIELYVPSEMKKTISKVLNIELTIVNYDFDTVEIIEETQKRWLD